MKQITAILLFATAAALRAGPIENLSPGEWYEVPNSHMRNVAFQWPSNVTYTLNGVGVEGVMDQWNSGAYDSKRDRLYVFGGGHNGYGGNEIYAFDLVTLKWMRLYDPSLALTPECKPYYNDGSPATEHTYDGLEYLPNTDRFVSLEGGCWGGVNGNNVFDVFDPAGNAWERKADRITGGYSQSAFDPVTGHLWVKGNDGQCFIAEYDPVQDLWTQRSSWEGCYLYTNMLEIDAARGKLVGIGGGKQWVWDISGTGMLTRTDLAATGPQDIASASYPGVTYDPVSGKIVGWKGGADVFTLDLGTNQWARVTPAPSNTVVPTQPNPNGTFGRFRYVPSKNVFVVVNDVDQNVYFYKLTAGAGTGEEEKQVTEKGKGWISVAPNPVGDCVAIAVPDREKIGGSQTVGIYNLRGARVFEFSAARGRRAVWDVRSVPPGLYFVRAAVEGRVQTARILVTR